MLHRLIASRVVVLLTCAGLLTGCVRTRVNMVAPYRPGGPPTVDRTPDVGVYKIKYAAAVGDGELKTLGGSKRFLGAGQPVGFERGDGGAIIAVAGAERFPATLPADARYCVWYTKAEEPTRFWQDLGDAVHVIGIGTIAVGALGAVAVLNAANEDDDCRHGHRGKRCHRCGH